MLSKPNKVYNCTIPHGFAIFCIKCGNPALLGAFSFKGRDDKKEDVKKRILKKRILKKKMCGFQTPDMYIKSRFVRKI